MSNFKPSTGKTSSVSFQRLEWICDNGEAGHIDPLTFTAVQTKGEPLPTAYLETIGRNCFQGYVRNMTNTQWSDFKRQGDEMRKFGGVSKNVLNL